MIDHAVCQRIVIVHSSLVLQNMKRFIPALLPVLAIALFFSCNNKDAQTPQEILLSQPPYDTLTEKIRLRPEDPDLYARRGTLLNADYPELAVDDFKKAWELTGNDRYAAAVGNILLERKPDSAVAFLEAARARLKDGPLTKLTLAYAYDAAGKTDLALKEASALLEANPQNMELLLMNVELLQKKKDSAAATSLLEKINQLPTWNQELGLKLAYQFAEYKNPRTLALVDTLIRYDTLKTGDPYYVKGIYYTNMGNKSAALAAFDETIRENYNYLNAYIEKGKILLEQKNNAAALKTFRMANTIKPSFPDAYYWIGRALEASGDKAGAKDYYQKAYGLDQSFTEARDAAAAL